MNTLDFFTFKEIYEKKEVIEYPNTASRSPLVSVCVQTYQHVDYIEECLEGILMQKTDFPFEILLGEDDSTDGTREICKKYAEKYPETIRLFLHHRQNNITINGTPTGRFNFMYNLFSSRGKYIAICEGDDYWIDNLKLQRQVEFLEHNLHYSMVTENSLVLNLITQKEYSFNKIDDCDITISKLLKDRPFSTASVLFRANHLSGILQIKNLGDIVIWCYLATVGKIKYFSVISSVYRRGMHGLVESTNYFNWAKMVELRDKEILKMTQNKANKKLIYFRAYTHYHEALKIAFKNNELIIYFICLFKSIYYKILLKSTRLT